MIHADSGAQDSIGMFDIPKGVVMLSILLFHTLAFLPAQYTQQIPRVNALLLVMFVIYGYSLKPAAFGYNLRQRFRTIAVPYLLAAGAQLLAWLPHIVLHPTRSWIGQIKYWVFPMVAGIRDPSYIRFHGNGSLWFILALFWAAVITAQLLRLRAEWQRAAAAVLCAGAGYAAGWLCMQRWGVSVDLLVAMTMCVYLYVGWLIHQYRLLYRRFPAPVWAALVAVTVHSFGYRFDLSQSGGEGLLCYLELVVAAFVLLRLMLRLNAVENALTDGLAAIGYCSLWVYLVHSLELECLPWGRFYEILPVPLPAAVLIQLALRCGLVYVGVRILSEIAAVRRRRRRREGRMV